MRRFAPALVVISFLAAASAGVSAQDAAPTHAPDRRAPQFIAPLYFPPRPNAPFTAIAKTLWVRTLPDGSTVTVRNERVIARDADGRIFQERRTFVPVPDVNNAQPRVRVVEYSDPVAHTLYTCNPYQKVCNLFGYASLLGQPPNPAGLQPDKTTYLTHEDLGVDTFNGLDVERSRETTTLFAASVGNSKTILRRVDYWYSPALDVNVQVKRHDPRDGDQTLWLSDISLGAPDPQTFRVPAEYRIIDHRMSGQEASQQGH